MADSVFASKKGIIDFLNNNYLAEQWTELTDLIQEKMDSKDLTIESLVQLYREECAAKNIPVQQDDDELFNEINNGMYDGRFSEKWMEFILRVTEIDDATVDEAFKQFKRRGKMIDALKQPLEREFFLDNIALFLKHYDLIMSYNEFFTMKLEQIGSGYSPGVGDYFTIGEVLYAYKNGYGITKKGCPHCGGDIYSVFSTGSIHSGYWWLYGACVDCKKHLQKVRGEDSKNIKLLEDPRLLPLKIRFKYPEPPTEHVPVEEEEFDKPWNIYYLVEFLKRLDEEN